MQGSRWFKKFAKESKRKSRHLRFVRVKCGFYRIYFKQGYVHEVYKEMPQQGYNLDDLDPRFENQKYFEEYEDEGEITRKIKNFVEGYWDSTDRLRTRLYMLRNDKEFFDNSQRAYQEMKIK